MCVCILTWSCAPGSSLLRPSCAEWHLHVLSVAQEGERPLCVLHYNWPKWSVELGGGDLPRGCGGGGAWGGRRVREQGAEFCLRS